MKRAELRLFRGPFLRKSWPSCPRKRGQTPGNMAQEEKVKGLCCPTFLWRSKCQQTGFKTDRAVKSPENIALKAQEVWFLEGEGFAVTRL